MRKSPSLISDEEYKHQKELLTDEKSRLEKQLSEVDIRQENWIDTAEQVFHFATNARYWFNEGTLEQKKAIVQAIGLNLTLENKLLRCDLLRPFELIQKGSEMLKDEVKRFEPKDKIGTAIQSSYSEYTNPIWSEWMCLLCTQVKSCLMASKFPPV